MNNVFLNLFLAFLAIHADKNVNLTVDVYFAEIKTLCDCHLLLEKLGEKLCDNTICVIELNQMQPLPRLYKATSPLKSNPEMFNIQTHFYEINIKSYSRRFKWNTSEPFYKLQSFLRSKAKYSTQSWISIKYEIPPYGDLKTMENDREYQAGIQLSKDRYQWKRFTGYRNFDTGYDYSVDLNLHVWIEEFYNSYLFY